MTVLKKNHVTRPVLLVWSTAEEHGLKRMAEAYHTHLQTLTSLDDTDYLADLAYTLCERRSRLLWRSFAVTETIDQLSQTLEKGFLTSRMSVRSPKIAFILTGQGAQWHGMGRELLQFSVYRKSLERAEDYLLGLGCPWLLLGMLSLYARTAS